MKRLFLVLSLSLALLMPSFALGPHGSGHHSSSTSHTSKKSHKAGSNDGSYQGGSGSSHKGGHYKNTRTSNHYRDRKARTPK